MLNTRAALNRKNAIVVTALSVVGILGLSAISNSQPDQKSEKGELTAEAAVKRQKTKKGEPAAIGYPCFLTNGDIKAAKEKQRTIKEKQFGEQPKTRTLYGNNFDFHTDVQQFFWYSNEYSSDPCAMTTQWHSGRVTGFGQSETCSNGVVGYWITVSD